MGQALGMRAVAFVVVALVVASGCATTIDEDSVRVVKDFGAASFCPVERVHATAEPELALLPPPRSLPPATPWVEPTPPDDIAADPDRLRLWKVPRDARYAEWRRQNAESDPTTSTLMAYYRDRQIMAVRGCGSTELYVCSQTSSRRGGRSCTRLKDIPQGLSNHVVCRNGGALHTSATNEETELYCSAPESPPAPDPLETLEACRASCPAEATCEHACKSDNSRACEIHCQTEASRCRETCSGTAHAALDTAGLCKVGLCEVVAKEESADHARSEAYAKADAMVSQQVAAAAQLREAASKLQECTSVCRKTTDQHTLLACMLECAQTARVNCEASTPNSKWCEAFRMGEKVLEDRVHAR